MVGVWTPKIDRATRPVSGLSDRQHEVFLNSTGRHGTFSNSTGRHEVFLDSTGTFRQGDRVTISYNQHATWGPSLIIEIIGRMPLTW